MKTVAEVDSRGKPVRMFHRTATAAWDHRVGEKYRYRVHTKDEVGRSVVEWREMPCSCPVKKSRKAPQDVPGRFPASEVAVAAQTVSVERGR